MWTIEGSFLIGIVVGFVTFFLMTHPSHPRSFKKRMRIPHLNLKFFEMNPSGGSIFRFHLLGYRIQMHHWLNLALIYFTLSVYPSNFLDPHMTLKGIIFGGLAQGLTYSDRFEIVKKISNSKLVQ